MKRYLNKAISLSLSATMIMGVTACNNSSENNTSTTNSIQTSTTQSSSDEKISTTEATTVKELTEGEKLAEEYMGFVETPMDLGGRTIKILSTSSNYELGTDENGNPSREHTSNTKLYMYDGMASIEKDYNCKFEYEKIKGAEIVKVLLAAKAAGDTYFDLLSVGVSGTYLENIYANNFCYPLESENVADIIKWDTNPWLEQSNFGNMFGHKYGVHFKNYNAGDVLRTAIVFNKDLAAKYNVGDLYEMVRNKTWTFEEFQKICASIASQANGETYPMIYAQEGVTVPVFVFANGGTFAENTENGYKYTALSDNTLEAINYLVDLAKAGYIHPDSENRSTNETTFGNGEAVFMVGNYFTITKLRNGTIQTEYEYGILPGPLGPHGDGEYNSVSYTEPLFQVANGIEKPEEIAAVLVAIANRTSKSREVVLEVELMNNLFDEESGEMLELMYDNTKCDFSRTVSTARSTISTACKSMLKQNGETEFTFQKTPKEALEEIEATVQSEFDSIILQE